MSARTSVAVRQYCRLKWGRWLIVFFICFGCVVMKIAAGSVVLQIPESVTVPGPRVSLMDLVALDGDGVTVMAAKLKAVDLGVAPLPGQQRKLAQEYVAYILKQYHLDTLMTLKMDSAVVIKSEGRFISEAEIKKLLEAQLPTYNSNYIARQLEISKSLGGGIWLDKGINRIVVTPLGRIPDLGPIVFGIDFYINEVKKKTIHLGTEIRLTGLLYQAKRMIKPKEKLVEADFQVCETDIKNRQQYYGGFPQECRAAKTIDPGETLMRNAFQQIPLVTKGGSISALVKLNDVEIRVGVEAKRDGWLGDQIEVVNSKSKQSFKARVIGSNLVEVTVE